MTSSSSLYGSTPQSGVVSSSNFTTLYSGGNGPAPTGNLVIPGTLTVNGCAILTNCNSFSLLPTTAETILFGNAATTMSIGSGTGVTTINNQLATANYTFPVNDGVSGQVLVTDGAGTISFAAASTVGKTYSIDASATTGGANFNLVSSDPTTDTIKFANGSGISIVRTDADTITITNTDPGSTGVTSLTGTANQINVSSSTGAVTLSTPQDIATTSTPTFAGATLGQVTVGVATDNTITTSAGDLTIDSATNLVGIPANLQVNSGTLFVDATTNRVGINNLAPAYELHIDQGLDGFTQFGMTTAERTALWTMNDGDDLLSLSYGSGSRLQFDPTNQWFVGGYTGINTATPAYTLDVNGSASVQGLITGSVKINGATSGFSNFIAPTTGSNLNYQLPGSAGAANTVLTNDGSGNLSWALPGGGGSTFGNVTVGVDTDNTVSTTTGDLVLDSASGTIALNVPTISTDQTSISVFPTTATTINIGDSATTIRVGQNNNSVAFSIGLRATIGTTTLTTTSTTTATMASTTRNAMKVLVNIKQGANVHCVEALALRVDATTALLTTYGEMYNTTPLATFTADVSSGSLRLLVTPTSATSTVFYAVRTTLD